MLEQKEDDDRVGDPERTHPSDDVGQRKSTADTDEHESRNRQQDEWRCTGPTPYCGAGGQCDHSNTLFPQGDPAATAAAILFVSCFWFGVFVVFCLGRC